MRTLPLLLLVFLSIKSIGQNYPQNYFHFPIKPGQRNYLSGTLGELRSHHYHSGIDIKTEGRVGLPIYAPADGYVARIKVSPYGYGKALYIQHPNGYTTVYAHIDHFTKELDALILQEQYRKKSFSVELYPQKGKYSFKQGDIISYAGNTGSSQAPHLHFEIRNAAQHSIDPLLFGFKEIIDHTKPLIKKIALSSESIDARIDHRFQRKEYTAISLGHGKYKINGTVKAHGKLGLEIKTYDQLDGASNLNGVVKIATFVNGEPYFTYHIQKVNFSTSRVMDCHVNYEAMYLRKNYFNKCYIDDGNILPYYKSKDKGYLHIADTGTYQVEIQVTDSYNNVSSLNFKIQGQAPLQTLASHTYSNKKTNIRYEVHKNILKLSVDNPKSFSNPAVLKNSTHNKEVNYAYHSASSIVYLWDLREGLPNFFSHCGEEKKLNFVKQISPHKDENVHGKNYSVHFPAKVLYDTLYFEAEENQHNINLCDLATPLLKYATVSLKSSDQIKAKSKTKLFRTDHKNRQVYVGGDWKENQISAKTRDLGKYYLKTDTIAPSIKRTRTNYKDIYFYISDNLSGISTFEAYLNDEWILMNYDIGNGLIWSERKDPSINYSGNFVLKVSDNCGNMSKFALKL